MEEAFYTGYCRRQDQTRVVLCELEDGRLTEADCAYPACEFAGECPIAAQFPTPQYSLDSKKIF